MTVKCLLAYLVNKLVGGPQTFAVSSCHSMIDSGPWDELHGNLVVVQGVPKKMSRCTRGKSYVHNNLCTLENHEKANRIIIISGTIIWEGSKFFPYLQFGILSSGSHEKIHNICINVIIKLHFVFADILDV